MRNRAEGKQAEKKVQRMMAKKQAAQDEENKRKGAAQGKGKPGAAGENERKRHEKGGAVLKSRRQAER